MEVPSQVIYFLHPQPNHLISFVFVGEDRSVINITLSNFTNNYATGSGGALYFESLSTVYGNNMFAENNWCEQDGGFAYSTYQVYMHFTLSTFKNHTALGNGGVFFGYQSLYNLEDSELTQNRASGSGGVCRIYANGSGFQCFNCLVTLNSAVIESGAFDMQENSNLRLDSTLMRDNWASGGGGAISVLTESKANITSLNYFDAYFSKI